MCIRDRFPSATADFFGNKNVGKNYGVVFTAYGVAGITGALVAGQIVDMTGSYFWAFITTGILAIVAVLLTIGLRTVRRTEKFRFALVGNISGQCVLFLFLFVDCFGQALLCGDRPATAEHMLGSR